MNYLVLLLATSTFSTLAFLNLTDARSYAATTPELVKPENDNILQPVFDTFYRNSAPNIPVRLLRRLGITKPLWSSHTVFDQMRQLSQSKNTSTDFQEIPANEQTAVYCVGPLYGAFHSLVRILSHFEKGGLITPDFKITKPNSYLVFLGNAINGTPYSLETLSLITALLAQNPDRVFYIQGKQEHAEYWINGPLKKDLVFRTWYIPHDIQILNDFFAHLPTRISFVEKTNTTATQAPAIDIYYSPELGGKPRAQTLAILQAERTLVSYSHQQGLMLRDFQFTTPVWSLFSAPTWTNQNAHDFFLDAYVLLTIKKKFIDSTVTVYNREVRSEHPFKQAATYNVFSGLNTKITPYIEPSKDNILIFGSTMDLRRGHREIGLHIKHGLLAAARRINDSGGIRNKLYKIAVLDDEYQAEQSRINIKKFISLGHPILISPVGSHTVTASLDLVRSKKIFILFSSSGSTALRKPDLEYLVNFRVSYAVEGYALTDYAAQNFLDKNFAFFYQNSEHGLSGLSGAKQALKKLGVTTWTEASYEPNTLLVDQAIKKIKKANPRIIGLFSAAPATKEFLEHLGNEFLIDKKLIALSTLATDDFKQYIKDNGLSVTYAQAVPNPVTSTLPIVEEYRASLAATGSRPNNYALEGYIYGSLAAELIKRIKGPITPAALASVVNNLKPFNFKGLQIQLDPKTRQLANYLWLETASGEWIEQKVEHVE